MATYICPYCFQRANTDIIRFQCANVRCTWQDRIRAEYVKDRPLSPGETPELSRTVFDVSGPGAVGRLFGMKAPRDARCPSCQQRSSTRSCPNCHSPFPHGVDDLSNMVIAIIGSKETGKSNYIAVLIQRIYELYGLFQWTLLAMDDATMKLYNSVFYSPLYEKGMAVHVTASARADDAVVRRPLLYSLSLTQGHRLKTITLAFFDTAGEDLSDKAEFDHDVIDSMEKINRYIYNAAGIILLVDPLRIPQIREKVKLSGVSDQTMSTEANTAAGNIIGRTAQLIFRHRTSRSNKIDIPLAVVFSKIDLLKKNILGTDAAIYQQSRHKGIFSLTDFQNNNDCIRDWIAEYDKQFIQSTPVFKESAFFGVSALGQNPDESKKLPHNKPDPIRVEDPFLWLLWKNGVIQGR